MSLPWQRRVVRKGGESTASLHPQEHGAGPSFRVHAVPKYPTKDANYRILARQRSRFTHYYFYIRDPKPSARWSCGSPRSCRSKPRITSMVTVVIEQGAQPSAGSAFAKTDNAFLAVG